MPKEKFSSEKHVEENVIVWNLRANGPKFLRTKKSICPSTAMENLNDLEILDVSKSLLNKQTAQKILSNFEPLLRVSMVYRNGCKFQQRTWRDQWSEQETL